MSEPLQQLEAICAEICPRWDEDMRSVKLLQALAGTLPNYRADVDAVRAALASKPLLWCCHVRGHDDVHPAPDYETALAWSDLINDRFGPHTRKDDNYPITRAAPAIWPWSPDAHAESLPKSIAEFAPRNAPAADS